MVIVSEIVSRKLVYYVDLQKSGVSLKTSVGNNVIRLQCGLKDDVVTKIEKGMLEWFGHMERLETYETYL